MASRLRKRVLKRQSLGRHGPLLQTAQEMALRELEYDGDIYVNQRAIEEALFGPIEDLTHEVESSGRPATKQLVSANLCQLMPTSTPNQFHFKFI